ncbi:MAG: hypothetical protein ACRER4_05525, partial [Steroidobacteraceae bacterium]
MLKTRSLSLTLLLPAALAVFVLTACGKQTPPAAPSSEDPAVQAEIDKDAEMKAKEEELARKEAELALREREADLAKREAELAKATTSSKPKPKPASTATAAAAPKPAEPSGPRKYTVAAGTSISVQLPATITTKN